jgi:hypothetical protein
MMREKKGRRRGLSSDFEQPVRRPSNGMILLTVFVCVIAFCRWQFGWGPLP